MGGKVLEYEAKTIRNEGIKEGVRIGIQEGIQRGRCMAGRELILEFLEELSHVPEDLRREITQEQDLDTLKRWSRLAARVLSVGEFQERYHEEP